MTKQVYVQIDIVHSPHDGGYYAEVWMSASGEQVYETHVCKTPEKAMKAACEWIRIREYRMT